MVKIVVVAIAVETLVVGTLVETLFVNVNDECCCWCCCRCFFKSTLPSAISISMSISIPSSSITGFSLELLSVTDTGEVVDDNDCLSVFIDATITGTCASTTITPFDDADDADTDDVEDVVDSGDLGDDVLLSPFNSWLIRLIAEKICSFGNTESLIDDETLAEAMGVIVDEAAAAAAAAAASPLAVTNACCNSLDQIDWFNWWYSCW